MAKGTWRALGAALAALVLAACGACSSDAPDAVVVQGRVTDASGVPIARASVYAVPAAAIDIETPMRASAILSGAADGIDEPLEDAIDREGAGFPSARTDDDGRFVLRELPAGASYFVHVTPASEDEALPGGSLSRRALPAGELAAAPLTIRLSSRPPPDAMAIGSKACLACHAGQDGWKRTPHALGVTALGVASALQAPDLVEAGWNAGVRTAFPETGSRILYFVANFSTGGKNEGEDEGDRDAGEHQGDHGQDSYLALETEPADWAFRAVLAREDGVPVMTLEDNPASAVAAPSRKFQVALVMGGQGTTQRFLTRVPAPGNPDVTAHYALPFKVQFEGSEAAAALDGTRGYFRGDHASRWISVNEEGDVIGFKPPGPKSSFEASCAACHVLDYRLGRDEATGFFTAQAFASDDGIPYGAAGARHELNVGCEACHGPGDRHRSASGRAGSRPGAFIVSPGLLSAEREVQICTQCHSRIRSNDTFGLGTRQPIGQEPGRENQLMRPGTRRADWFRYYVTQRDAEPSLIWEDDLHSDHPHQQATDHVKSVHYRNRSAFVSCSDCHGSHARGPAGWARGTQPGEVAAPSTVCLTCHEGSLGGVAEHERHRSFASNCTTCHMPRTARDGAGRFARKGSIGGVLGQFWEGDLSSHVLDVPTRYNPAVVAEGKTPETAMPIPYTNACGGCHKTDLGGS